MCIRDRPDPLQYFQYPWLPTRWRSHCKEIIEDHWVNVYRADASSKKSLIYFDVSTLNFTEPHRIWKAAGLDSIEVKKATVVMWFLLNVYHCNKLLLKMKRVGTSLCTCCDNIFEEDVCHILLFCQAYREIREPFLTKLTLLNNNLVKISDRSTLLIIAILDPESSKLPNFITDNWTHLDKIYSLSRTFCLNIHQKRDRILKEQAKASNQQVARNDC